MNRRQRLGFLALAAIVLIVALVVLIPRGGDPEPERAAAPTATAAPTTTASQDDSQPSAEPTPEPTADPGPILTAGNVTRIEVSEADQVRFRARSDEPEELHVHGYDLTKELEAGKTETISFKATIEGIFEIEFEHSKTQVAELRVEP
jgi:hypothetical protein